jgi:hypothetical protein
MYNDLHPAFQKQLEDLHQDITSGPAISASERWCGCLALFYLLTKLHASFVSIRDVPQDTSKITNLISKFKEDHAS